MLARHAVSRNDARQDASYETLSVAAVGDPWASRLARSTTRDHAHSEKIWERTQVEEEEVEEEGVS